MTSEELDLGRGEGTLLVLLDLSAAFDTIDHGILLTWLEQVAGLGGAALQWVRPYLADRTQCVSVNGARSSAVRLSIGVPQGSVLGPLLFLVYIQPLHALISRHHNVRHHGYADDRQVYNHFDLRDPANYGHALQRLELCVEQIRVWMLANRLMLNSGKTEYMVITSQHYHLTYQRMQPCLTVGGATVPVSLQLRNLGSIMDSTMSMDAHIQSVKCAMYFHLQAIKKIRHFLDRETCIRAVISLVMSRLDYCNVLLIGKSAAALHGLQVAQNYAARVITGLGIRDHITAALRELHWLPCSPPAHQIQGTYYGVQGPL